MLSIVEEINKRIDSIKSSSYPAIKTRELIFIYKMLDLLMQAKQEFGKDYVEQFIDLKELEMRLINLENLLLVHGSTVL
ncbi:hypothetical protein D3C86_2107050 [compost metagenome]